MQTIVVLALVMIVLAVMGDLSWRAVAILALAALPVGPLVVPWVRRYVARRPVKVWQVAALILASTALPWLAIVVVCVVAALTGNFVL